MKHLVLAVSLDSSLDLLSKFADVIILDQKEKFNNETAYETIYIRSHFSHPDMQPQVFEKVIAEIVHRASSHNPNVVFIDSMDTVDTIVHFEDKWIQYRLYGEFMPETWRLNDSSIPKTNDALIFKKRLSSRGNGISWDYREVELSSESWIAQQSLNIDEELRIYIVNGNVCTTGSIRTSKTSLRNASIHSVRLLTHEEVDFAIKVSTKAPNLNLIGLDVAIVGDKLFLLEVNRSPGFAKFYEYSQINLAESLYLGSKRS